MHIIGVRPLWEGRYKASPIQKESYLLSCLRYVELNPVRAAMVASPEAYPWSSYCERIGLAAQSMLDLDECYLGLGSHLELRRSRYMAFINKPIPPAEQNAITTAFQRNQLTGNTRFVDEIEQRMGFRVEQRGRGRPKADGK